MPSPAPSETNPMQIALHGVETAFGGLSSEHPLLLVALALIVVGIITRRARVLIHSGPRDRQRRFTRADKSALLALAGNRCEHHGLLTGRCRLTKDLEADHVHPWSRGGWTHMRNGQILCRAHNRTKRAAIPWNRTLRKLAERRATYYPTGAERTIVRRPPRRSRKSSRGGFGA